MSLTPVLRNQDGITLIEAMITIVILTIGIFGAMAMQVRAIGASSTAMYRTEATNLSISLLETMKQIDFDNPNLLGTGDLILNNNERSFDQNTFPELQSQLNHPIGTAAGIVIDNAGLNYRLFWDVNDIIDPDDPTATRILEKTIRVYISWDAFLGENSLEMTTTKYRNITL